MDSVVNGDDRVVGGDDSADQARDDADRTAGGVERGRDDVVHGVYASLRREDSRRPGADNAVALPVSVVRSPDDVVSRS